MIATPIVPLCRGAARAPRRGRSASRSKAKRTAELPEKLVGAMRLRNVDFDGSYEDLCDGEEVWGPSWSWTHARSARGRTACRAGEVRADHRVRRDCTSHRWPRPRLGISPDANASAM